VHSHPQNAPADALGGRRLRLREFLPRVGIDASTWSDERLDDLFNTYLVVYEAAWRSFPDAEPA